MKKILLVFCVLLLTSGCVNRNVDLSQGTINLETGRIKELKEEKLTKESDQEEVKDNDLSYKETKKVSDYVKIEFDNKVMIVELYPEIAPITVKNFQNLVKENFYEGLTFHRLIPGFMAQGGAFDEEGKEKEADTIKGEFRRNGFDNELLHTKGVISMARLGTDFDSASSQFFICFDESEALDGEYASFGKVISDMSTLEYLEKTKIEQNPKTGENSLPKEAPVIDSIKFVEVKK